MAEPLKIDRLGLPRREFLRRSLAFAAGAFAVRPLSGIARAKDEEGVDTIVVHLADTHASHHRYPAILRTVRAILQRYPRARPWIALNGDIFERGDAISLRSNGWADLTLLRRLRKLAPVIWNLGNHDFDILDPVGLRDWAGKEGIILMGNMAHRDLGGDGRFGKSFIDGGLFQFAGVGVPGSYLYPAEVREGLSVQDPAETLRSLNNTGQEGCLLLSHAGLELDRNLPLRSSGPPSWIVGAHNHQTIAHATDGAPNYFQHGFGGEVVGVTRVFNQSGKPRFEHDMEWVDDSVSDPDSAAFTAEIERVHSPLYEDRELEIIGRVAKPMSLAAAAQWATVALRAQTGADFSLLNHTSFGRDFPAGPVRQYAFDRWIRFENNIVEAEIEGTVLGGLLKRANPGADMPFEERSGDFLHTSGDGLPQPGKFYRVVTSDWVASDLNRARYLPGIDAEFQIYPELTVREAVFAEVTKTL